MQLYALDWQILQCRSLRVFHDTQLAHHSRPEIVACTVQNIALRAFLQLSGLPVAPSHITSRQHYRFPSMRRRRFSGLLAGLWGIPGTLRRFRINAASYLRPNFGRTSTPVPV